jgi:hypothetical protein
VHEVGLGVDRRVRIERAAQAVLRGRPGRELRDAQRAGAADRERVEVRLGVELRGQERGADAPALGGPRDRRREARRNERRQRRAPLRVDEGLRIRAGACLDADARLRMTAAACAGLVAGNRPPADAVDITGAADRAAALLDLLAPPPAVAAAAA